ncbi:hypothetical protein [Mycolicibacterium pulveris]|uniref:hypothetical protein n=1 Tax=Mycolicibacterium pulveris TaxID=36813 RepID=UPI003CEE00AF
MKGRGRLIVAFLFMTVGGLFMAGWSITWLVRESYLTATIMLALGTTFLSFAIYAAYVIWGTPQPRTESCSAGTIIRPHSFVDIVAGGGFISGTSAAALYLVFAPLGMVDYVPTGVLRVTVPAFCIFMLFFGVPIVFRMVTHGESHLRLDPAGWEVWNGQWGIFKQGTWDEVEQILDHPVRGRKFGREVIVFVMPKGRNAMLVSDAITENSRALREWVRFYWQHPEYRGELTDGRALHRLANEKFTAE